MVKLDKAFIHHRRTPDLVRYIRSLDLEETQNAIRRHFSKAFSVSNFFEKEDLEQLYQFAFSRCAQVRQSSNGTIFISGDLEECFEPIKEKVLKVIPMAEKSPTIGGNFFITPTQYGLHNDAPAYEHYHTSLEEVSADHPQRRYFPWKNIIIPLWVEPAVTSQLIFFSQRYIGWAHVFNHQLISGETSTRYPVIDDMTSAKFYDCNGDLLSQEPREFSEIDHNLYFKCKKTGRSLTPRGRLTNLSIETVCDWTPGDLIVFDSSQLHATNRGENNGLPWNLKMGLLLTFALPMTE